MSQYKLTAEARNDLRAITRFTRHAWGRAQMVRYLQRLKATFQVLVEEPHLGRPEPSAKGVLRFEQGRHVIFFERGEQLLIIRVLHDRMLPKLHLDSDEE